MTATIRGFSVGIALLALSVGALAATATRTSSFDYYSGSGILSKEVIEPLLG